MDAPARSALSALSSPQSRLDRCRSALRSWITGLAAGVLAGATAAYAQEASEPAATAQAHRVLEAMYARYLAAGRGDVEIHLSTDGLRASARSQTNPDGSFTCHVFGLRPPGGDYSSRSALLMLAGTLLHETTHCQVTPYALELRPDGDDPLSTAISTMVLLTLESVSDARAVIELFRQDGVETAQEFVAVMLPLRVSSGNVSHATAAALRSALAVSTQQPHAVQTDADAFAAALHIGRDSAWRTFRKFAEATGQAQVLEAPALAQALAQLDAALERAELAFHHGRYENNAATVRVTDASATAGDYHFFVGPDGSTRTEPALGAEGARHAESLKALLSSSTAAEHELAVLWLRHEGTLDAVTLPMARGAFGRLLQAFGGQAEPRREQVVQVMRNTIAASRRGDGLSAVLDAAADALKDLGPALP